MKYIALTALFALAACAPFPQETTPESPQVPVPQEEQGETLAKETVSVEDPALVIAERLLPSGFIEIGDRDAPVSLLVFTEHHCRYCKDFYHEHFPLLLEEYIEPGKMRVQIGILPLQKYAGSENAALGLLCAALQGKGIPMHALLFDRGARDAAALMSEAAALELDATLFRQCIDSPDTARTVERQKSFARSLDVTLVPTLFLNGEKSVGLPYYADLKAQIAEKLSKP